MLGDKPSYEYYEKTLIDIINKKNMKAHKYNKDLNYIELFIKDKEEYFQPQDFNTLSKVKESRTLLDAIETSKFIRLYLFSKYNNKEILFVIGKNPNIINNI